MLEGTAGVVPLATTLDSVGPLTRTAEDAALVTAAIAGPDPLDPSTVTAAPIDFSSITDADIKGMRISALSFSALPACVDADVAAA